MSYGERYIKAKAFSKYFDKIAKYKGDRTNDSGFLKELEFFEKSKLLFPAMRFVVPEEYAIQCAILLWKKNGEWNRERVETEYNRWPEHWKELDSFIWKAHEWGRIEGDSETKHPFDRDNKFTEYQQNPAETPAKEWSDYTCKTGSEDYPKTADTAEHYYHYYQIHLFDAIRRENTIRIIADCSEWYAMEGLPEKQLYRSHSFGYLVRSGTLKSHAHHYEQLSIFSQAVRILSLKYFGSAADKEIVLLSHDEKVDLFRADMKTAAKNIVSETEVSYEKLYEFLNNLCKLYIEYENHGRVGLQEELRTDISRLIDLLSLGYEKPEDDIFAASPSPPYGGWRSTLLDWVFPNLLEDAEKTATRWFEANLGTYNNSTLESLVVGRDRIPLLFDFLRDKSRTSLALTLSEIGKEWQKPTPFFYVNMAAHFRSLTVCVEDLAESLGYFSTDNEISTLFASDNPPHGFEVKVKQFFKGEPWWTKYIEARKKVGYLKDEDIASVLDFIDSDEIASKKDSNGYLIQNVLATKTLRDFFNHRTVSTSQFNRDDFSRFITKALHTVLLLWGNAISKRLVDIASEENND